MRSQNYALSAYSAHNRHAFKAVVYEHLDGIKAISPVTFTLRSYCSVQISGRWLRPSCRRGKTVMDTADDFNAVVIQRRQLLDRLGRIDH